MPPWKWVPQFSPYPQLKCLMKHSTFYSSLPSRRWQNLSLQELGNKINMMALTADWTAPWITLQRNATNGAWLLVRGLVKRPGKARPNRLSNSTLEFHQTTYQKPYAIIAYSESLAILPQVQCPSLRWMPTPPFTMPIQGMFAKDFRLWFLQIVELISEATISTGSFCWLIISAMTAWSLRSSITQELTVHRVYHI